MWGVLCKNFFQRYVPEKSTTLDLGAGFCEFINSITSKNKIACDINEDMRAYADDDVEVIIGDSVNMPMIGNESVDVVFISNLFEHLVKEDIVKTLMEVKRILKPGGKILILQPNIRYCVRDYWMYYDHITPLDDRSMTEVLEIIGYEILKCIPRFLPYTTKGKYPKSALLVKLYLKLPFLHKILGQQLFLIAKK